MGAVDGLTASCALRQEGTREEFRARWSARRRALEARRVAAAEQELTAVRDALLRTMTGEGAAEGAAATPAATPEASPDRSAATDSSRESAVLVSPATDSPGAEVEEEDDDEVMMVAWAPGARRGARSPAADGTTPPRTPYVQAAGAVLETPGGAGGGGSPEGEGGGLSGVAGKLLRATGLSEELGDLEEEGEHEDEDEEEGEDEGEDEEDSVRLDGGHDEFGPAHRHSSARRPGTADLGAAAGAEEAEEEAEEEEELELPLAVALDVCVIRPLLAQYRRVSRAVVSLCLDEGALLLHLRALRRSAPPPPAADAFLVKIM
jgi:hypothetical protein